MHAFRERYGSEHSGHLRIPLLLGLIREMLVLHVGHTFAGKGFSQEFLGHGAHITIPPSFSGYKSSRYNIIPLEHEKKRLARFAVYKTRCRRSPVRPTRPLTIINTTCESMS